MSKLFFTSDTHYGHANVIKYCNRPFRDVEEMREVLINSWNAAVSPGDTVIHMGDFSFHEREVASVLPRLNGTKHLVLGNHDKPHPSNKGRTQEKFLDWVSRYKDLGFEQVRVEAALETSYGMFRMCHLPYEDKEDVYQDGTARLTKYRPTDDGLPLLCGHVHERWLTKLTTNGTLMINVGVDAPGAPWFMRPASLEEVLRVYGSNS
jgi:calcineurin-like phosphoesterase family protein